MFNFSQHSLDNLTSVHPDLIKAMASLISVSTIDFGITEGLRTKERQQILFDTHKSQTMNSRHLTGKAVDFVVYFNNKVTWEEKYYKQVADLCKQVSKNLNIPIIWGGDWTTFKDLDHFELDYHTYP